MKKTIFSLALMLSLAINANTCFANNSENLSAQEALSKLIQGNERFVTL